MLKLGTRPLVQTVHLTVAYDYFHSIEYMSLWDQNNTYPSSAFILAHVEWPQPGSLRSGSCKIMNMACLGDTES